MPVQKSGSKGAADRKRGRSVSMRISDAVKAFRAPPKWCETSSDDESVEHQQNKAVLRVHYAKSGAKLTSDELRTAQEKFPEDKARIARRQARAKKWEAFAEQETLRHASVLLEGEPSKLDGGATWHLGSTEFKEDPAARYQVARAIRGEITELELLRFFREHRGYDKVPPGRVPRCDSVRPTLAVWNNHIRENVRSVCWMPGGKDYPDGRLALRLLHVMGGGTEAPGHLYLTNRFQIGEPISHQSTDEEAFFLRTAKAVLEVRERSVGPSERSQTPPAGRQGLPQSIPSTPPTAVPEGAQGARSPQPNFPKTPPASQGARSPGPNVPKTPPASQGKDGNVAAGQKRLRSEDPDPVPGKKARGLPAASAAKQSFHPTQTQRPQGFPSSADAAGGDEVNPALRQKLRSVFYQMNTENKDYVLYSQLRFTFQRCGLDFGYDTVGELFTAAEADQSGHITYGEWVRFAINYPLVIEGLFFQLRDIFQRDIVPPAPQTGASAPQAGKASAAAAAEFERKMEQLEERLRYATLAGKTFDRALLNCRIKGLRDLQAGLRDDIPSGPAWQSAEIRSLVDLAFKVRAAQQ
eukprot:TRINITY_DN19489_c0_g1_i1.p1 TRINITY_DN19489_c0_g1~~TRINITY_DN19489_c0_g1_i1.p1  ORF type:complete len:582 (+),score=159.25 TRINITY_DN19489_c0_g1_i1:79-1824(+)